MIRRSLLLAACILACTSSASAVNYLDNETYKLENGMTVILHRDPSHAFVAVHVRYRVGAINEVGTRTGLAHLFEHLLFRSTEHLERNNTMPGWLLSDIGARGWNGSTYFDTTDYYEVVPTVNLESVLWMESDRMGFPLLSSVDLVQERKIVLNERRQRIDIVPYGRARHALIAALFPHPHPYHESVIGSPQDLAAIRIEDIKQFHRTWYGPENAILTISGGFNIVDTKLWVKKYFETLPSRPTPPQPEVARIDHTREIQINHREEIGTLPKLLLGWLTPPALTREDAAFELLALLLERGRMGRLRERLVPQLALNVSVAQQSLRAQSIFHINVDVEDAAKFPEVLAAIDATLQEIATQGVSEEELVSVRRWARNHRIKELQHIASKAELLSNYMAFKGKANWLGPDIVRYQTITSDKLQALVRDYLKPQQRVAVHAVPAQRSPLRAAATLTKTAEVRP